MDEIAWVALSLVKHLGGKTFQSLLTHFFQDLDAILSATPKELRAVPGVGPKIAQAIAAIDLSQIALAVDYWREVGIQIIPWDAAAFPLRLRALVDAPPTLFALGDTCLLNNQQPTWAIVGTRNPSPQAQELASHLASELAEKDVMIISGLAMGVDTAAHVGTLAVPNGVTAAVLGSGVLNIYPQENQGLAEAITQRGLLLCEVSPNTTVSAPGLVARNRLITGLSDVVVIVETSADGGAMHAARFAKQQGKRLVVVENNASGNQQLITEGAEVLSPGLDGLDSFQD